MSQMIGTREIRTTRQSAPRPDFSRFSRTYVVILSRLLKANRYARLSDLTDDAKCVCAKARIPYDTAHLTDTIRWMWQQRRGGLLVNAGPVDRPLPEPGQSSGAQPLSRARAAEVLSELTARTGREPRTW